MGKKIISQKFMANISIVDDTQRVLEGDKSKIYD